MTFGSLFSGIGGLDLGLERAGMECRWQVELDPFCALVLAEHWPEVKRYEDIRGLTGDELEPVDLICGGFPCQDLSQAGKRAGIEGTRSGLWFEFARIIGVVGPRYVLIENVPGLLVPGAMRRVVGELARQGYVGCWRCLRASEFGASHLRKRVFIVAYCNGERCREARQLRHATFAGLGGISDEMDRRNTNLADGDRRGLLGAIDGGKRREGDGETQSAWSLPDVAHCQHERRIVSGEAYDRNGNHASGHHVDGCDPIVANAGLAGNRRTTKSAGLDRRGASDHDCGTSGTLADAGNGQLSIPWWEPQRRDGTGSGSEELADPERTRLEVRNREREQQLREDTEPLAPGLPAFAPGPADPRWPTILAKRPDLAPAIESPVRGVADGIPDRLDRAMRHRTKRLGRLGNAVVPDCAQWIGEKILAFEAEGAF